MILNKPHISAQREESNSLTIQPLLFIRRPDISPEIRLFLAIAGLCSSLRNSTIRELMLRYNVSHTFIYNLSNILRKQLPALFGMPENNKPTDLEDLLSSIRFLLHCKLETKSPLHGLSNFASKAKGINVKYHSTNFISQLLEVAGSLVGSTYKSEHPLILTFLCDEVYSGGQAILVTIEAQSMTVLDIRLVSGSLSSVDWENSYECMEGNGLFADRIIKDQGKEMQAAVRKLLRNTIIGADTFHAVALRLGRFRSQLERALAVCEKQEADRTARFSNTKTYATALKIEKQLEAAKYNTLEAADQLNWFDSYYFKMIRQLRPFTSQGLPRDKAKATAIMRECIEALALLSAPKMQKHLAHIETLLNNGELLHYMDQVPELYRNLQNILHPDTTWLWMLYWQLHKKSYQSHSPKVQQKAKQEAQAAKELLQQYYRSEQAMDTFKTLQIQVFKTLDKIVQASSLVETFNSILKPFIKSARGQVSQELLNLVMFYHNHRVFERGKRKGKAPIEILTGETLEKSWIDLLMDKIEAAFIEYDVCSLKQLHSLICPKKQNKDGREDVENFDSQAGAIAA